MAPISQREARRLWKRVGQLEGQIKAQRSHWGADYPGGVEITSAKWEALDAVPIAIRTARKLNHAVVCIANDNGTVRFIALPHPSEKV